MQPQDKTVKSNQSVPIQSLDGLFAPGQVIGEKYKVVALLGAGGMGTVYKVQHLFLNKIFALKTLDSNNLSEISLRRFQQEAKAASSLTHPNLVHVSDFGLVDELHPYLVMDFVDGITFADYLRQHGPLAPEEILPFFAQACFGLLAAHEQSVIHRDIKPGNIMIVNGMPLGSEGSVKIVDFGIAKLTVREDGELQALTRTGEIFGSPLYMSPEQCMSGYVDNRSDIYSLGCVLFEMLTGTPPHLGQNALATMLLHDSGNIPTLKEASLGKDFPLALENVVSKMLRRSANERYQNVGLVAHDLADACRGREISNFSPVKAVQAQAPKVISLKLERFCCLLLATAFVAGFLGYAGRQIQVDSSSVAGSHRDSEQSTKPLNVEGQVKDSAVPLEDVLESKASEGKKELADFAGPIKSIIESVNGVQTRKFIFPGCGIGTLYNAQTWVKIEEAMGMVSVPGDIPLRLCIGGVGSRNAIEHPSIFSKIDKNEFVALTLSLNKIASRAAGAHDTAQKNFQPNVSAILKYASAWTNLKDLTLDNMRVTDALLAELNNTKALRSIRISKCTIGSSALSNQSFLHQVEVLYLIDVVPDGAPVDKILQGFYGSLALHKLVVRKTPLSAVALHKLSQCRNLIDVEWSYDNFDDRLVKSITEFKSVRNIYIVGARLTSEQINRLLECSWFNRIKLSLNDYTLPFEREKLRNLDHRIVFGQ